MKLIDNWKQAPRMFSMWAYAAASAIQGAWLMLDEAQRASLKGEWVAGITIAIVVLGAIGRLVQQDSLSTDQADRK